MGAFEDGGGILAKIYGVTSAGVIVALRVDANGVLQSLDNGPAWTSVFGVLGEAVSSANASSTPLIITDAPTTGQKIVLDDIEISVDTAMTVTLRTTTGNKVLGKYYLPANGTIQVTTRGRKKAPTANQTLEVLTSASGNVSVCAVYHSEV
jgi:hypothetical protein